jgi:hypothetical protein
MVLLGDEAQVEAQLHPFGDSSNLEARELYGMCRMYHRLKIILDTPDGTRT